MYSNKKLLITGAGRCNLSNQKLDASFYNPEVKTLIESVFAKFGKNEIEKFFNGLDLAMHSDKGRIFPRTNQASSVLSILEIELGRLQIPSECNCEIANIQSSADGFILTSKTKKQFGSKKVILAGGGKSYPALGSDGNAYSIAKKFGHKLIEPVPSAVPLLMHDTWCHFLQGQKTTAIVTSVINSTHVRKVAGEVLFTKYGISGTAVLDISDDISVAFHRHKIKNISIEIDFIPFLTKNEFVETLTNRLKKGFPPEKIITGIVSNKFSLPLSFQLKNADVQGIANLLKNKYFRINGTRGWNEAEFTAGGIDTSEVNHRTLESKLQKGFYLAGEILDVNGVRGGYNLAWAWASGFVAGLAQ